MAGTMSDNFTVGELVQISNGLDELGRLRRATGGLDPALVAKALGVASGYPTVPLVVAHGFTDDEVAALRAATFEAPGDAGGFQVPQ